MVSQVDIEQTILSQSNAVRTLVLPEIRSALSDIRADLDSVNPYKTDIIRWLEPIIDLSAFHVYPMSGITQGLDWWYDKEQRGVATLPGDYQWIRATGQDMLYMSWPSAIDGNYRDIPADRAIALDLAYIGSAQPRKISSDNVERAFFSLSKTFGIRNLRTGWYFTREPDHRLDQLIYGAKYFNRYACDAAETIIKRFSVDYVYSRFSALQRAVCDLVGLEPSDVVWLATSSADKWLKFRRAGNLARICLAGVYDAGLS